MINGQQSYTATIAWQVIRTGTGKLAKSGVPFGHGGCWMILYTTNLICKSSVCVVNLNLFNEKKDRARKKNVTTAQNTD